MSQMTFLNTDQTTMSLNPDIPKAAIYYKDGQPVLYVFGYGSLFWKQDCEYSRKIKGSVKGYKRRFYQGSWSHRGTKEKPGRVVTLIPSPDESVYGIALQIVGEEKINKAMSKLCDRECQKGGYIAEVAEFNADECTCAEPIRCLLFRATDKSEQWEGEDSEENLADIIAHSVGAAGSNIEYFILLHEYIKKFMSNHMDPHLDKIRSHVESIFSRDGEKMEEKVKMDLLPVNENFDPCENCGGSKLRGHK